MSVPKSIQRIVIVPRGSGMSNKMKNKKGEISGIFEVRVYAMDFFKLSKIKRPEISRKQNYSKTHVNKTTVKPV